MFPSPANGRYELHRVSDPPHRELRIGLLSLQRRDRHSADVSSRRGLDAIVKRLAGFASR
jgi:hypothetical protein